MLYAGFKRVESWWNFNDVISPFYRLYYIEAGKGKVYINNIAYELNPGQLFLIPKFAYHSYECKNFMDHYYICFFDDLAGGFSIPNPLQMHRQLPASSMDCSLIKQYLELNPNKSLPAVNPLQYDNARTLYERETKHSLSQISTIVQSQGILLQLFSRFLTEESLNRVVSGNSYTKLDDTVQYINKNLDKRISVVNLSEMMCISPDHFSKIFRKIIGVAPCEYIQMKKIERAQTLLLTSSKSITEIAECVGIYSPAQFTRLFTKFSQCSPREYRIQQLDKIICNRPK